MTFFDLFNQKNDTLAYNFNTKETEDYGRITIKIENQTSQNLIIELLEGKNKILLLANAPHPDVTALKQSITDNINYTFESYIISYYFHY